MVILALDYGDARTGVAVCDAMEMLATPVEVIHQPYAPKVIDRVIELCEQYKPREIVVGLPKNMDATIGERAEKCRRFADSVQERTGIPVTLWDERLTTVSAHGYLNQTNTRGKKRKNTVDAVAATIILQAYLDARRQHSGNV